MSVTFRLGQDLKANKSLDIYIKNIYVGAIEGAGNARGQFLTVIKLNKEYHNQGIGFLAFKEMFDLINRNYPITTIVGSWHKNEEFKDFEEGMSSNLKIFKEKLETLSPTESALETATGKWAGKLGFINCEVQSQSINEVIVHFTK